MQLAQCSGRTCAALEYVYVCWRGSNLDVGMPVVRLLQHRLRRHLADKIVGRSPRRVCDGSVASLEIELRSRYKCSMYPCCKDDGMRGVVHVCIVLSARRSLTGRLHDMPRHYSLESPSGTGHGTHSILSLIVHLETELGLRQRGM